MDASKFVALMLMLTFSIVDARTLRIKVDKPKLEPLVSHNTAPPTTETPLFFKPLTKPLTTLPAIRPPELTTTEISTTTNTKPITDVIQPCDSLWTCFNRKCYYIPVLENSVSWIEAQQHCDSLGGNLAAIHDEVENMFLFEWSRTGLIFRRTASKETDLHPRWTSIDNAPFVGLAYDKKRSLADARWFDASPVDFAPDVVIRTTPDAKCLVLPGDKMFVFDGQVAENDSMLATYDWTFVDCDKARRHRFICEKKARVEEEGCEKTPDDICGISMVCPELWTYFEPANSCYMKGYISNQDHAVQACKAQGGELAFVQSDLEYDFLINMTKIGVNIDDHSDNGVWISGVDYYPQGSRVLIGRIDNPKHLYDGSIPSSGCLALYPDGVRNLAVDQSWTWRKCDDYLRGYMCKKPAMHSNSEK